MAMASGTTVAEQKQTLYPNGPHLHLILYLGEV
jgi:hypothetical protein